MDIVFIAQGAWDDFFRTYLVEAFPPQVRVLYVEPPVLFPPVELSHLRRLRRHGCSPWLQQVRSNVWVVEPFKVTPNLYFRLVQVFATWFLAQQLRGLCRRAHLRPTVLWLCDPYWRDLRRYYPDTTLVYDCFDDYDRYPGQSTRTRLRVRADEEAVVRDADLCIAISRQLEDELRKVGGRTALLPIGLDSRHFCRSSREDTPEPPGYAAIPHPRIGVFSRLDEKVDIELLQSLATTRPEWHFVFIGPLASTATLAFREALRRLQNRPNVHILGGQPYSLLPAHLWALDVGLVPYVVSEQTNALMPSKVINYLAAGVPVVSIDIRGSHEFLPWVRIAGKSEEFPDLIREELEGDHRALRQQRIAYARDRDWSSLARQAVRWIGEEGVGEKNGCNGRG